MTVANIAGKVFLKAAQTLLQIEIIKCSAIPLTGSPMIKRFIHESIFPNPFPMVKITIA